MPNRALQCYLIQRVLPAGSTLAPAPLLHLATAAGAAALGIADETGDFTTGKSADLVRLRAPEDTPLAALIAPAGAESVRNVRIRGKTVVL